MSIHISCNCGQRLQVAERLVGKHIRCGNCKTIHLVPQSDSYKGAEPTMPPRRQPKARRNDDDAEEPLRSKESAPSQLGFWLVIGMGAFLFFGGIAASAVLLILHKPDAPIALKEDKRVPVQPVPPRPEDRKEPEKKPEKKPFPVERPEPPAKPPVVAPPLKPQPPETQQPVGEPIEAKELVQKLATLGRIKFNSEYGNRKIRIKGLMTGWTTRQNVRRLGVDGVSCQYNSAFQQLQSGQEVVIEGTVMINNSPNVELGTTTLISPEIKVVTNPPITPNPTKPGVSLPVPKPDQEGHYSSTELQSFYRGDPKGFDTAFAGKTIRVRARHTGSQGGSAGRFLVFEGVKCASEPELENLKPGPRASFLLEGVCRAHSPLSPFEVVLTGVKVTPIEDPIVTKPKPADFDQLPSAHSLALALTSTDPISEFYKNYAGKPIRLRSYFQRLQAYPGKGRFAQISRFLVQTSTEFDTLKFGQEIVLEARCPNTPEIPGQITLSDGKLLWAGPPPTLKADAPDLITANQLIKDNRKYREFNEAYFDKVVRVKAHFHMNVIQTGTTYAVLGANELGFLHCHELPGAPLLEPGSTVVVEGLLRKPGIIDRDLKMLNCKLLSPTLDTKPRPPVEVPKFANAEAIRKHLRDKFKLDCSPPQPEAIVRGGTGRLSEAAWEELAGVLPQLEAPIDLKISYMEISADSLEQLAKVKNLVRLAVGTGTFTNSHLQAIGKMTDLKSLRIQPTTGAFDTTGIEHLSKLSKLEELSLSGQFKNEDVAPLNKLTALKSLSLSSSLPHGLNTGSLSHLSNLTNLERIYGHSIEFWQNDTLQILKKFPKLDFHKQKTLSIYAGKGFTDEGMDQLQQLAHAEEFSIFVTDAAALTGAALKRLGFLTQLKRLTLNFVDRARPDDFKVIGELKDLEYIHMQVSSDLNEALVHLADLPRLKTVSLLYSFSDAGLVHLGKFKAVEDLMIGHNPKITDAGLEHLKSAKTLKSLNVFNTKVTDTGVARLKAEIPGLKVSSIK